MTKGPRIYNVGRTGSLMNGVRETGQPHAKEWNWTTILHQAQKLTQNGLKTLMLRNEIIKLLEENIGTMLLDIGLGNNIL